MFVIRMRFEMSMLGLLGMTSNTKDCQVFVSVVIFQAVAMMNVHVSEIILTE